MAQSTLQTGGSPETPAERVPRSVPRSPASTLVAVPPSAPRGPVSTLVASGPSPAPSGPVTPRTPPTSSDRLALLAAQLPSVPRDVYEIGNQVAKGGIGRVVRARDQRLDRPVAIKELLVWNEQQEQRFVREALLTARLQHPAIVPVYEAGRWPDGEPFYAMKLVSGRTLSELIDERKTLGERLSLLPHVLAVAQAIAYAHSQRIIHRDLKPANVLVGEFGETVVIDWGLAKGLSEEDTAAGPGPAVISGDGLTIAGAVVGTPAYMPPEQAAGSSVDERADVYAIGAMLYHLLAAKPPYGDVPWEKLLSTIALQPPRAVESLAPEIPDELRAIVHKAMAREPTDRYRTAKELADDLSRFQSGQIVGAHKYSSAAMLRRFWRRHRSVLSIAAAAVVLITGVVIVAFVKNDQALRFARAQRGEAEVASKSAQSAREAAEEAGRKATLRADEMTLLQAQGALGRDPNEALAWLKTLSPELTDVSEVRRIAADAQALGISRAFRGHKAHINHIAPFDDGLRVVTASDDKTLRLWDVRTGESVLFAGHTDEAWVGIPLPGEKEIVSMSKDGTVRLWDLAGKELQKITLPAVSRLLAPRADGSVVGSPRGRGLPWILPKGASEVRILTEPGEDVVWSTFSYDGETLLFQEKGGKVYRVEVATGARRAFPGSFEKGDWALSRDGLTALFLTKASGEIWNLKTWTKRTLPIQGRRRSPTFSPRGDLFVLVLEDRTDICSVETGKVVRSLPASSDLFDRMAFSADGKKLVTAGYDRAVRTWDLATGVSEAHYGLKGVPSDLVFLPGSQAVMAVSSAGEARLFEPARSGHVLADHHAGVVSKENGWEAPYRATGLALSAQDRIASIDQGGVLQITALDGSKIAEHKLTPAKNIHLVASPDKQHFAGASFAWKVGADGRVPEDDAPPGGLLIGTFDSEKPRIVSMPSAVRYLVWRKDGSKVLAALADGTIQSVDLEGHLSEIDRLGEGVMSVAVSEDGAMLAEGGEKGLVRLTDMAAGKHRDLGRHSDAVLTLAFSAGGARLATGSHDHTARLWRLEDGSFRSFDSGGHGVDQAAFSPDDKLLYLLSNGETQVRRLDVEAGEWLSPVGGNQGVVLGFVFSADRGRLLTPGLDGVTRVTDLATGKGRALSGHKGPVVSAAFAQGGKTIVTLGLDGTLRSWPDDLPATLPELRAWIDSATPDHI